MRKFNLSLLLFLAVSCSKETRENDSSNVIRSKDVIVYLNASELCKKGADVSGFNNLLELSAKKNDEICMVDLSRAQDYFELQGFFGEDFDKRDLEVTKKLFPVLYKERNSCASLVFLKAAKAWKIFVTHPKIVRIEQAPFKWFGLTACDSTIPNVVIFRNDRFWVKFQDKIITQSNSNMGIICYKTKGLASFMPNYFETNKVSKERICTSKIMTSK